MVIAEHAANIGLLGPMGLHLRAQQCAGHLVERGVVKDAARIQAALYVKLGLERQRHSFLPRYLQQAAFRRGIVAASWSARA